MEPLPNTPVTGPVTETERTYALNALQTTQGLLHEAVAGLSPAQLTFKTEPGRWSIAECVEHIVLVERGIFKYMQRSMDEPADAARRAEIKVSDVDMVRAVRSRGVTLASPAPFVPTGRYGDTDATLAAFDEGRSAVTDWLSTQAGDLRTHFFPHIAFGTLDGYQAMLLISAHGERHRKQIEEIKTNPAFPRD
ncbi:DinB family protein [Spirosoma luteolum]